LHGFREEDDEISHRVWINFGLFIGFDLSNNLFAIEVSLQAMLIDSIHIVSPAVNTVDIIACATEHQCIAATHGPDTSNCNFHDLFPPVMAHLYSCFENLWKFNVLNANMSYCALVKIRLDVVLT